MANSTIHTKVAVFGAGRWGMHLVRNFQQHPQAEVVAVCDPNPETLAALNKQLTLPPTTLLTDKWQRALEQPELEAVVIATPACTHFKLVQAALQQGLHVLVEKPLTLTVLEAQALCQLAQQQQRQLVVDHTYLFNPAVWAVAEQVQAGAIGKLRYGYAARTHLGPVRQDVDALWDLAIHDLAMFNLWTGSEPVHVQAMGNRWLQAGQADLVWARLAYPSGFEATLHLCWCNPDKQRRSTVVGSQGAIVFEELRLDQPVTLYSGAFEQRASQFLPQGQATQAIPVPAAEPLAHVCDHFLACVHSNQPSTVSSGRVGAELVKVLVALSRALEAGTWIEVEA
ncbi:Gfo/Idh/MocA family protein [Leptolyngbya sp. FACHB-261]|uniref:Gfo/Idh/MocA family protein n=1 Tax=Leptolyngbya sp. FACHB-261 TaxID=2692806 RepID=UPI0016878A02|nr:Gfo/Idh/MocA family oxidoreductase [Leptolyngbya sp. FACHB-261]MBD2105023.1 Gfo/Idh/MocA family oxidoreductase [Leptolyngbya sp. FACHB-261]